MSMCGICWFDGRALTDEIDDLRQRVKEAEAKAEVANKKGHDERSYDDPASGDAGDTPKTDALIEQWMRSLTPVPPEFIGLCKKLERESFEHRETVLRYQELLKIFVVPAVSGFIHVTEQMNISHDLRGELQNIQRSKIQDMKDALYEIDQYFNQQYFPVSSPKLAVLDAISNMNQQAAYARKIENENYLKGNSATADVYRVMANTIESYSETILRTMQDKWGSENASL